jgi:Carboxypeptidase regulatory-like domain
VKFLFRLTLGSIALLLLETAPRAAASQTPNAPAPQIHATPGSISGFITDRDGDSIPEARVTLTRDSPAADIPPFVITADDGSFSFDSISPGPFQLAVTAAGFSPIQTSSELHVAETLDLPAIALVAAASTDIRVTATQAEIAEAQVHLEEKQRVLGVFPNFYVSYVSAPMPMTPKEKYQLALRTLVDPVSFILIGVTSASEQADNIYDWGQGAQGFSKRYAAAYGTFLTGDMLGNAVFPVLFKQDPRYFYKGTGSIRSRILYAIATTIVCKGDNHHWQFDYSGILGGLAASGISNAYYPASNRTGVRLLFEGTGIGIGSAAIQNVIQEFLVRHLTPHIPPSAPVQ